ncbi:MAG: ParB/RepB/Spo0J family partition protein [Actinomycetota bacterium]
MNKRSGLGRGLDALLPAQTPHADERAGLLELALDEVDANPLQPRTDFGGATLRELAASIRRLGVLQPLLVRPRNRRFELIAGERRLRAARIAGLSTVPVVVVEADERGSLERALVENLHREDLNPIEEAAAYRQLIDEGGLTQEELGSRLERNRVTITNALRLLDLPTSIQAMLVDRALSAGHGRALLGLADNPFQERLARRVAHEKLSVRETEDLVRRYQSMSAPGGRGQSVERPAQVADAQRELADRLQTRVRVEMGKRKGRIVVDFVSLEELDRLVRAIAGDKSDPERVTPR